MALSGSNSTLFINSSQNLDCCDEDGLVVVDNKYSLLISYGSRI